MKKFIPIEQIQSKIYIVRATKVMLDSDLAHLYGVSTKQLNQQVRRNTHRFPDDFMIRLTIEESRALIKSRSQIVTMKHGYNVKYPHLAFSEEGIGMLSSVLRSERAVQVNIMIVRAFVRLRQVLATHKDLAAKLETLEKRVRGHDRKFRKQDGKIKELFEAIWQLMNPGKQEIGFKA